MSNKFFEIYDFGNYSESAHVSRFARPRKRNMKNLFRTDAHRTTHGGSRGFTPQSETQQKLLTGFSQVVNNFVY